jgi:hypothetical protein
MIKGAIYWNDPDKYYIQTNNPTEEILRKSLVKVNQLLKEEGIAKYIGFLESCGSSSGVNCSAVHNYNLEIICPGDYKPQPEECLNDWFNDPRNYSLLEKVRKDIGPEDLPGNRVPQYYPPAMKAVFNVECEFVWVATHHQLADYFSKGYSVQLLLRSPSHYIAGVAYDFSTSEFIINDSWPGRFKDDKGGFNRRMISSMDNLQPFAIVYPPKE